jgi:DNA repair protein RadC
MAKDEVRERLFMDGPGALSDADLLTLCGAGSVAVMTVQQLAWVSVGELRRLGLGESRAAMLAAAFELGRRGAWAPPKRGERCLSPKAVYELMRPVAHASVEEFHTVLLDVKGRLIRTVRIAQGSLAQCPVNPSDVFRAAIREAAHSLIFVHGHPSGDPTPSSEDWDLTERLIEAAKLVGVVPRDHLVVAANGYFSFVEAGRWRF